MWFLFARRGLRLPAFIVFLAMFAVVQWWFSQSPLKTCTAPLGIISLQLAGTEDRAREIIESWAGQSYGLQRVYNNLYVDFFYIIGYSTVLGLACLWARDVFAGQGEKGQQCSHAGWVLAWGQLAAGLFDTLENLATFKLLSEGVVEQPWPATIMAFALFKDALIITGIIYIIIAVGICLYRCSTGPIVPEGARHDISSG